MSRPAAASLGKGLFLAPVPFPTWLWRKGQLPSMQGKFQRCVFLGHEGLQVKREGHDVLADLRGREGGEQVVRQPQPFNVENGVSEALLIPSISPDVTKRIPLQGTS